MLIMRLCLNIEVRLFCVSPGYTKHNIILVIFTANLSID